ncbi:hypothetical protein FOZ63_002121 [Perkinsus olseni]|uniref:Uncharacterized protein n=1 Tax=Perkinsus olseni TaxID=32597 RepID=A0A7J6TQ97_PEROL|nr:hypothetical protein FOZ63_002121 [Perkinsus olseni]
MRTLFVLAVTLALTVHTARALETWKSARAFLKTKKGKIWKSIKVWGLGANTKVLREKAAKPSSRRRRQLLPSSHQGWW